MRCCSPSGVNSNVSGVSCAHSMPSTRDDAAIVHRHRRLQQAALDQPTNTLAGLEVMRLEKRRLASGEARQRTLGKIDLPSLPVGGIEPVLCCEVTRHAAPR